MSPTEALSAATIVKVLIDVLALAGPVPHWIKPLLALLGGIAVVLCLQLAGGDTASWQGLANAVLSGIMAGGTAVGVTELGKKADRAKRGQA